MLLQHILTHAAAVVPAAAAKRGAAVLPRQPGCNCSKLGLLVLVFRLIMNIKTRYCSTAVLLLLIRFPASAAGRDAAQLQPPRGAGGEPDGPAVTATSLGQEQQQSGLLM